MVGGIEEGKDSMSDNLPQTGGTLRVGLDWEVDVIDPPASFGGWNTGRVVQQIFESLVEDDLFDQASPITRIVSALAESYEVSADGRMYRFQLRRGVSFHDGAPFDAEAVKANFGRMWNPLDPQFSALAADYNRVGLEDVAAIRVLAPYEIEIELKQPFPEFLRYMTQEDAPGSQVLVSPRALAAPDGEDRSAGTGPFRFKERLACVGGSGVRLVRNLDYWGGPSNLDGLTFLPFPDMQDRVQALRDGEIDFAYGLDGADLEALGREGFVVRAGSVPYIWYFIFNMADPYLADRRVRRAIAYGFNRQRVSEVIFRGHTRLAAGMLPPASPSFDTEFQNPYPYDPVLARRLLDEAALPDDWTLKVKFAVGGSAQLSPGAICGQLAADMEKLGIKVELLPHPDWVSYCTEWRSGMADGTGMSEMSWGMSCDIWLEQILHSRNRSPAGFNAGGFADSSTDDLLERARRETDDVARCALYRAAHARVMEELPVLPVVTVHTGTVVHHPRVRNFLYSKQNWHSFAQVWLAPL
jgi:peptide/nickel transport system substrate-binding protein